MAKGNAPLLAFNRGEVSRLALPRIDIEKLRLAAECQVNWMPSVLGPMMLRCGAEFIAESADQDKNIAGKLLRFFFSPFDTALVELANFVMRIVIDDVLVTRASVATAVTSGTFASSAGWDLATGTTAGNDASIAGSHLRLACPAVNGLAQARQTITVAGGDRGVEHGLRISVARGPVTVRAGSSIGEADIIPRTVLDTGVHSLACTPNSDINLQIETDTPPQKLISGVSIDPPGILTLPAPWSHVDLGNIRPEQSGDIIFVGCHGYQQYKIERRSATGWSIVVYQVDDGPFGTPRRASVQLAPAEFYGTTTLTANRPFFNNGHVGALFRLYNRGQVNRTLLGGNNAFTPAIRVTGVGALRNFNFTLAGVFLGTLTLQISFDGPDSGFVDTPSVTAAPGTYTGYDSATATTNLDNQIVWYRVGFKIGDYFTGACLAEFNYRGGSSYGVCRVLQVVGTQVALIDILKNFSHTDGTFDWIQSDWSLGDGYPDCPQLHEGRLGWFGRDRSWQSESDDYAGFAEIDEQGLPLGDAGVINEAFGSGPVDSVNWGLSLSRLLAGREGSIASIRSSSLDEVMTPTNVSIKDCATQGAARLPAVKVDKRGMFVEKSGRRVYELIFNPQALDYEAHDLTRLNTDIGKPGFRTLDVARQPDTMVSFVRQDGQMAALLHAPEDEVECWWRMMTLGIIEDVCVLPSGDTLEDRVYLLVRRFISATAPATPPAGQETDGVAAVGGGWKRFIEKLAPQAECEGGLVNRLLDCHTVTAGSHSTVTGLTHMIGETLLIWADGRYRGTAVVNGSGVLTLGATYSNSVVGMGGASFTREGTAISTITLGTKYAEFPAEVFVRRNSGKFQYVGTLTVDAGGLITLPQGRTASKIMAFIGYMAPFRSAKLAYGAQAGSPLTQKKKIDHVGLVGFDLHPSGLKTGQTFDRMDDMPLVEGGADIDPNEVNPEYDEPMFEVPGEWDTDARLCLLGQAPFPAKVGAVALGIATNEKV